MNPQTRRRIASAALIIGFFLLWEFLCRALNISDIVLPKPSQILDDAVAARAATLAAHDCRRFTPRWSASPSAS